MDGAVGAWLDGLLKGIGWPWMDQEGMARGVWAMDGPGVCG